MIYEKLDTDQRAVVDQILEVKQVGLYAEAGTGKTWMCCGVVERLASGPFLIVSLKANKETTWAALIKKELPHYNLCDDPKRVGVNDIVLLHYEQVPKLIKRLKRVKWKLIVYDEAHRLNNRGSISSRRASQLCASSEYRIAATGTPLETSPIDAWAQYRFIKPALLSKRWADFEDEYVKRTGFMGYTREFKKSKLPQLISVLGQHAIQMSNLKSLPPLVTRHIVIRPTQTQRDFDESLKKSSQIKLGNGQVLKAELAITRDILRSQLAGGVLKYEGVDFILSKAKAFATRRIIRRSQLPVVVFYRFKPEMEILRLVLSEYHLGFYHGKVKDKATVQTDFQNGRYDVLLVQERSGGTGLDLFASCVGIIYSSSWSSVANSQMIKRLHRRGQEKTVHEYVLITKDSIDADRVDRIKSKLKDVNKFKLEILNG